MFSVSARQVGLYYFHTSIAIRYPVPANWYRVSDIPFPLHVPCQGPEESGFLSSVEGRGLDVEGRGFKVEGRGFEVEGRR